jgi:hypothetical protein
MLMLALTFPTLLLLARSFLHLVAGGVVATDAGQQPAAVPPGAVVPAAGARGGAQWAARSCAPSAVRAERRGRCVHGLVDQGLVVFNLLFPKVGW